MRTFSELSQIIENKITQIKLPSEPKRLYEPITYTISLGGKRLRPIMTLMAYNLFSKSIENAVDAAIAIEVFHNFTLLHDDIMDKAPIRRGKITAYKKWNENIALLSGDAMLIKSYQILANIKSENFNEVLAEFSKFAIEVCEGQQLDIDFEEEADVTIEEYLNMIRLKTSVLFAGASKIGAMLANATKEDTDTMYEFGLNFGLGFQLQDDLLDTFGDEKSFGKSIGGDIISNKKTILLIKAFELANNSQKAELTKLISQTSFDKTEKIKAVKNIFKELNINIFTKKLIEDYYSKATNCLNKLNIDCENKNILKNLLVELVERNK